MVNSNAGRWVKAVPVILFAAALGWAISCGGTDGGSGGPVQCSQACPGGQFCDFDLGCVECSVSPDCPATAPVCLNGKCEACANNSDCAAGQACFPDKHDCQPACTANADCPGDAPICDPVTKACMGCLSQADCPNDPFCSPVYGQCVKCLNSSDCGATEPICDIQDGECRQCLLNSHCGLGEVCKDKKCTVEKCSNNNECPGDLPICKADSGDCVECLLDATCEAKDKNKPFCSPVFQCVKCLVDTHCDPGKTCQNFDCK